MWCRTVGASYRNLDQLRKCRKLLIALHARSISAQPESTLKSNQVIKKIHYNSGKRKIKIFPPASAIPSQTVVLPGSKDVRASTAINKPSELATFPDNETLTVSDVMYRGIFKSQSGECLGTRDAKTGQYVWVSYSDVMERMRYVGSAFISLGITPSQQSLIGICTKNRKEFILTMLGCSCYSMPLVPLYESFGAESLSTIIAEGEMQLFICETTKIAEMLLDNLDTLTHLKYIIIIEASDGNIDNLKSSKVEIMSFKTLEDIGKSNIKEINKPKPEDLFCICYTSGTTGAPKGVMVTHANVMSCIASLTITIGEALPKIGILISYLPCAHIYEIINEIFCLYNGGKMGFYSGDINKFRDDVSALKPTVIPLVPKLMNAIYTGTRKKIMPYTFRRILYRIGLESKYRDLKRGIVSNNTIWDKLIFSKVQDVLGGHAEVILTSSAPVSKEVMKFFRCASGCLVYEAYGQSEVCAATMTLSSEHESGFVGPPLPSNHIKLIDVPDSPYNAANGVGEICIRGTNVFLGYYKNPEATHESIDEEGWHHTGDIGKWMANGALAIIDRKKHIFKLSQGEYIAPEKTENAYMQSHILSQVFVDGLSDQDFVIAIVVPNKTPFLGWVEKNGFKVTTFEELCQQKEIRKAVLKHLLDIGTRRKLNSLHQAGNIYLCPVAFTVENHLLTPTLKLRRSAARTKFEKVIKDLYSEGSMRKECKLDV